jgi:hypothetical protein
MLLSAAILAALTVSAAQAAVVISGQNVSHETFGRALVALSCYWSRPGNSLLFAVKIAVIAFVRYSVAQARMR